MSDHDDTPRKALAEAVRLAGGQGRLAKTIGVQRQNVWDWLHVTKEVRPDAALKIERVTGVSRRRLAPSFDWDALPEPPPPRRLSPTPCQPEAA